MVLCSYVVAGVYSLVLSSLGLHEGFVRVSPTAITKRTRPNVSTLSLIFEMWILIDSGSDGPRGQKD